MTAWRKSSHSEGGGAIECVELADLAPAVGFRDSKDPAGGHLTVSRAALRDLFRRIKH